MSTRLCADVGSQTTLFVFGTEEEKGAASTSHEGSEGQIQTAEAVSDNPLPETSDSKDQFADQSTQSEHEARKDSPAVEDSIASTSAISSGPQDDHQQGNSASGQSFNATELRDLKVVDLRDICKENDLRGYSKLKKEELVDLILSELTST